MNTDLVLAQDLQVVSLADAKESARLYMNQSKADATLRAYRCDRETFKSWCEAHGVAFLPASPVTVSLYIASMADAGRKVATIGRHMASISKAHQAAGLESPAAMRHAIVSEVWKGIRRTKGIAQTTKAAAVVKDLRRMVKGLGSSLIDVRDRALLLVGFAGAFRRSELVALTVADVETTREGLTITLRRSKTDQEGAGRKVGIPYGSNPGTCPVRSLEDWLNASGITDGPLFRSIDRYGNLDPRTTRRKASELSAQSVALIVKKRAAAAGLDPEIFSGHSLRAGLATSAAQEGKTEATIMKQTGHRSVQMVRRYIRDADMFRDNAAAGIGL